MEIIPLFPELEVPELNTSLPLTPELPAFTLAIRTEPLEEGALKPLITKINPPVKEPDSPETSFKAPPEPLLPLPTVMLTSPPRPPVENPLPSNKAPVFPLDEVPLLNISFPLVPDAPALTLMI